MKKYGESVTDKHSTDIVASETSHVFDILGLGKIFLLDFIVFCTNSFGSLCDH